MSQHDYVIANASGAVVRADINSVLQAIISGNSGTSAPSTTVSGMWWLDTTGGAPYTLKIRDAGNNHWLSVASITDPGSDGNLSMMAIEGTSVLSTGESGASKFLREDGDGSCSWQTPSGGKVLQVGYDDVKTMDSSSLDYAAGNWTETGISIALTPSSATNYLVFNGVVNGGNAGASYGVGVRVYIAGGGTDGQILMGDAAGSRSRLSAGGPTYAGHNNTPYAIGGRIRCNDSTPNWSSGALTITVQFASNSTSHIARLNQAGGNADDINYGVTASFLTIYEIEG